VLELIGPLNKAISPRDRIYPEFIARGIGDEYFASGLRQLQSVDELLAKYAGKQLRSCASILDFACHYGRHLRYLRAALPNAVLSACDIDEEAVEFCRREFGCCGYRAGWQVEAFSGVPQQDLILCSSLVTHVRRDFLADLLRVWNQLLKPGGVLIFTFLGERYIDSWLEGKLDHYAAVAPPLRHKGAQEFNERGHVFCGGPSLYSEGDDYGIGFVSSATVRQEIQRHPYLQLCAIVAGITNAFGQDLAMVKKTTEKKVSLPWRDEYMLDFGDVRFEIDDSPAVRTKTSTREQFVLVKNAPLIQQYIDLLNQEQIKQVVELGIYKGGSCALFQRLLQPDRLVALDISPEPEPALTQYIEHHKLSDRIKLYYGTDQADRAKLIEIIKQEFAGKPIDLVVDDASHFLRESTLSFNTLFPYLRPGGYYIIEDWGWAHWRDDGDKWRIREFFADHPPMTHLVFELIMFSASRPDLLSRVIVNHNTAVLQRGPGAIDPQEFELSKLYVPLNGANKILSRIKTMVGFGK
jgi:SAM-dependent methyltransferase